MSVEWFGIGAVFIAVVAYLWGKSAQRNEKDPEEELLEAIGEMDCRWQGYLPPAPSGGYDCPLHGYVPRGRQRPGAPCPHCEEEKR